MASIQGLTEKLTERFSSAWVLLSKTTQFLSKTPEFNAYEKQLMEWRLRLQSGRGNSDIVRAVHDEIVDLRKELRVQGYDLSLVDKDLLIQGFRNDGCLAEGFRRMVIVFTEKNVAYYLTGDDNHIAIGNFLENALEKRGVYGIDERHYLWYRWNGPTLVLSGADTEDRREFERLESRAEKNKMKLLSQLRNLA